MLDQLYRLVGFAVCHQLPERTLLAGGTLLPVCARDTGIYWGYLVAFAVIALLERDHPRDMPPWPVVALCVAFIGAMGVDGLTSYVGLRQTSNDLRLITGLMAGFAIPPLVLGMLGGQLWAVGASRRLLSRRRDQLLWLAAMPATFLALRFPPAVLGPVYAALTAIAVVFAFVTVNLVMVALLPPFERRARRLRDLAPMAAIALAAAVVELAVAGWLHAAAATLAI